MKLIKARVQNFRSIIDSGEFEIEKLKTIMVGPNEAGKTVLLKAIQQLNKPDDVVGFEALRDYPRSKYNDIDKQIVNPKDITVVTGYFELEQADKDLIPEEFRNCTYKFFKNIDNSTYHDLIDAPSRIYYTDINKSNVAIRPEIGLTFLGLLDLNYGYNFMAINNDLNKFGGHLISLRVTIGKGSSGVL